jgi:HK97 gp10 family phage protein
MARGKVRIELIGDKELHEKLHRLGKGVQAANSKAARAGEMPILAEATAGAHGPHILARQSKRESTEDLAVVDIGPDKEHWFYQFFELGAKVHTIKAKKAKALAFEGRNGLMVIQSVQHPGMKKKPFLKKAMTHNIDLVREIAGKVFLDEINKETIA